MTDSYNKKIVGFGLLFVLAVGLATLLRTRHEIQGTGVASGQPLPGLATLAADEMALKMQLVRTLPSRSPAYIRWSPDGSRLATAEVTRSEYLEDYIGNNHALDTYSLRIYDAGTGEQLADVTLEDVSSMEWSPDGSLLAVGLDRFRLKVYERDGTVRFSRSTPFPAPGTQAANWAAWGKFTSSNNTGSVAVAWSPDGHLLASAAGEPFSQTPVLSADGAVRLWDPATGQLAGTIKVPADPSSMIRDESQNPLSPGWVRRVQWTPGGHIFLPDGEGVWDPTSGRRTQEMAELKASRTSWEATHYPYPYVMSGHWSPDGRTFALNDDRFIRLCDPVTGRLRRSLPDALPPGPLPTEAPKVPLSESELMATAEANMVENGYDPVRSFAWSPDSRQIANPNSGSIRVWDVATGRRVLTIRVGTGSVAWSPDSVAWSPDGKVLVAMALPFASAAPGAGVPQPLPGGVNLWDARSGKLLRNIGGANNIFAWSPRGSLLAVSTADGVQLWGVPADALPQNSPTAEGTLPADSSVPPAPAGAGKARSPTALTPMLASNPSATVAPPVATPTITSDIFWPGPVRVKMVDQDNGWAVSQGSDVPSSDLLRTTDGGKNWANVAPPGAAEGDHSIAGMYFLDAITGWVGVAVGEFSKDIAVYHTTDSGRTWAGTSLQGRYVFVEPYPEISFDFLDAKQGWVMVYGAGGMTSTPGQLFATNDGGKTWTEVASTTGGVDAAPGQLPFGGEIRLLNAATGWVVGSEAGTTKAGLYATRDGGRSWQEHVFKLLDAPIPPDRIDVLAPPIFFSEKRGVVLATMALPPTQEASDTSTVVFTTLDGGKTWWASTRVPSAYTYRGEFTFLDSDDWWVWAPKPLETNTTAPMDRRLYRTTTGRLAWTEKAVPWDALVPDNTLGQALADGYQVAQLDFVSERVGWALLNSNDAGKPNLLLKTNDGGQTWEPLQPR